MIRVSRLPMALTAIGLGLFHSAVGILWSGRYQDASYVYLGIAIYLATLAPTILLHKGLAIPAWQGTLNLLVAAVLPQLSYSQITQDSHGTYATWFVGALGVLLGATALRGQAGFAWAGLAVAVSQILVAEGTAGLGQSGMIGLTLLVLVGHATNLGLKRSEADIERFNQQSAEQALELKRAETVSETKQRTFDLSLAEVQNLLRLVVSKKGRLNDSERREAIALEQRLSDEIMGGHLVTTGIKHAARLARGRGVEIYLIDEGGLENLSKTELETLLRPVEDVINKQLSGKVTVSSKGKSNWQISVVGFERGSIKPNVDLKL